MKMRQVELHRRAWLRLMLVVAVNMGGINVVLAQTTDVAGSTACRNAANNNPELEQALARLPQYDTNVLLRGAAAALDWQITALRRCGNDAETQAAIESAERQQQAALATCRQLAATDNCDQSPFGELAATEAEAQAERDRAEVRNLINQFSDALAEAINAGNHTENPPASTCIAPPGGVCTAQ